ncbi:MAG: isoprenylcysteine carboxylmethyltransferase family protein [Anaerolineales bacterium]|nr:isoprenylcysteine carboxylmethyltransferase family protein [Chloroflexota bacterium]MBL6983382.1 isoprenylcysteine carboxylmethyltransferase family protein [Anaerolineales bacterium]
MNSKKDARILPPTYLFVSLLAMLGMHYLLPITQLVPKPWILLGILPLASGIVINIFADKLFSRAKTTINSFGEPTTIITDGIYSATRNPMYLGMALLLLGVAILLGSLSPFFVVPVFVWLITVRYIRFEEKMLEDTFGLKYLDYARRVRRWI